VSAPVTPIVVRELGQSPDRRAERRAERQARQRSSLFVPAGVLATLSFGAGFCVVGSQIGANALASTFYPAAAHATGIGWALGIGRLGAIAGPLLGGLIVARNWSTATVFALGAIPSICASIAILAMGLVWAAQGAGSPSRSSALTD